MNYIKAARFALALIAGAAEAKPCGYVKMIGIGVKAHIVVKGVPKWASRQVPGLKPDDGIWQHASCNGTTTRGPVLNSCWDGLYGDYIATWNKGFAGYSTAQAANLPRVTSETGWDSSTPGSALDYQGKIITLT